MKNILIVILSVIAASSLVFGFQQRIGCEHYRDENQKLRLEMKKLSEQAQAARVEAAKLRYIIDTEKKKNDEMMKQASGKKK